MTEKRFMVDDAGTLIDMQTGNTYDYVSDVCPLLNALNDENEQLKHDATVLIQANQDYRKENEQLKQQLEDNLQFLIRASKRLGFESLDHLLYTLDKGEITGYSTANWGKR